MEVEDRYIVILAGGIGIKFWPTSRYHKPKQFLDLLGTGRSLLQMTFDRFRPYYDNRQFIVVTNTRYLPLVKEQLPELADEQLLVEPLRRDTAVSIALASYKIKKLNPNARVLISPSDQLIFNEKAFFEAIELAMEGARESGNLVTLGIRPNRPDTSYGYIQYFPEEGKPVKKVKTFTEKPDLSLATTFLESGDFVWNSGTFIWKNKSIIASFEKHLPEIAEVFEEGEMYFCTENERPFLKKAYSLIKNISIDHGVLEKSDEVFTVLGDFGWSDLGSWQNLYEVSKKDEKKNTVLGEALLYDTENCFIKLPKDKLLVVQGLKEYLISDSDNVLLICKLGDEGKFREFVTDAKKIDERFI
ncbi:mannose-1-phosphate guanylyltransferase [Cyclobacterium jeungdonense]|uniref:Sugar phosphate nucleotidyltransferase n=1 Tax=Cyclobacterium jeungdonense TaxID=708087 RepID=A0ABT8C5W7_9BACT|nr:sugar phosphate nucleotidyltransferase [Cyclobacterium jeungdonense]MDN3688179.1 sugar phosphate nucleotidyltransferase [Cyclobacterium jeungdonense]